MVALSTSLLADFPNPWIIFKASGRLKVKTFETVL
jgi:hypothetical protein